MKIRDLLPKDKPTVDRIYGEFFSDNEYPDFHSNGYRCPFAITDDNDRLIVAGGIRLLPEVVLITNKDIPVRIRYEALLQALGSSATIAADLHHNKLYAFVSNDEKYVKILQKHNFKLIKDKLLVLNLGD